MENQVSMFDIIDSNEVEKESQKYRFVEMPEMDNKELLNLEKEMLGIYISGHPLDKIRESIEKQTNIKTIDLVKINEDIESFGESKKFKDGQAIKFAGIINKVTKKFTRNNTIIAFLQVEDFYGIAEIIIFDSIYSKCSDILVEDNIVLIEGKLNIREDENAKIIATNIKEFSENDSISSNNINNSEKMEKKSGVKTLIINITSLTEEQKNRLRGAIKFFSGDRVNVKLEIKDGDSIKPCGAIFLTDKVLKEFEEIIGSENIVIKS